MVLSTLLVTLGSGPAWKAQTREVSVKVSAAAGLIGPMRIRGATRRQTETGAGASPGTASVAVATLEAAALRVRPQRPNEWTQGAVDVIFEEDALLLECGRRTCD